MSDHEQLYAEAGSGNAEAVAFLRTIVAIAHTWDDLVDRDKPIPDSKIHEAFTGALLTLPANAFYAKWRHLLEPVLLMGAINWRAATSAEREDAQRVWPFVMRSSYVDLLVMVKALTAGVEAAVVFAVKVRDSAHEEGLAAYRSALAQEQWAKEA